jgi:uncharacterized protein YndB with AHSA1/START domain
MSDTISESMTQATEPELSLTRFYVATPRQVFDMWTQARRLRQWWGPEDARLADCNIDLRPGGSFGLVLRRPGGKDLVQHGSYLELNPPHRLTFTLERDDLPGEPLVTSVTIEEMGAMCRMTVHQSTPHAEPYAHLQLPEWLEALTRLSELLE